LPYFPIAEALATKIDDRALFSGVFHNLLDVHLAESEAELREKIGDRGYYTGDFEISALKEISSVGNSTRNPLVVAAASAISKEFARLPDSLAIKYATTLLKAEKEFHKKFHSQLSKLPTPANPATPGKKHLTDTSYWTTTENVKELLPNLRDKLKKLTESAGKKSELADFLGAPLASVSRWLSGDREPGGEITLKLLKWVEKQERK
jgi:DNA-binding transcriptional regulator YiaG